MDDSGPNVPDVHSPEFRNFLFNHMLHMTGCANELEKVIMIVKGCETPKDLNLQKWMMIVEAVPKLEELLQHSRGTMMTADMFTEDPEAMDVVTKKVLKQIKDEHGDSSGGT